MGKISDYTRVLAAKLADVFVVDQTDNGTTETKSATVEQIGTAIGKLQNFADLDTSNKNLVDAINEIASYTPVYGNTASGAIATFDTSLALPLQDCTIDINAVQESGTPTPSSPKLISGFTGATIYQNGENLWTSGDVTFTGATKEVNISLNPNTYYISAIITTNDTDANTCSLVVYYTDNTYITVTNLPRNTRFLASFTATKTVAKIALYSSNNYTHGAGDTATWANIVLCDTAPTTTAISWQSEAGTVYGGSLDVTTGLLTVTHGITTINDCITNRTTSYTNPVFYGAITGLKPQTASVKCDYFNVIAGSPSASAFANASSNYDFAINSANTGSSIQVFLRCDDYTDVPTLKTNCGSAVVIYELAQSTQVQLTPTAIQALQGTNNVFCDTNGNANVIFVCSLKDYIDSQ